MAFRSRRASRAKRSSSMNPLLGFLLIASFGILFAGCGGKPVDEFVITDQDAERFREVADSADGVQLVKSGSGVATSESANFALGETAGSGVTTSRASQVDVPNLDLSNVSVYDSIRAAGSVSTDAYIVNNDIANVRAQPSSTSPLVVQLRRNDAVRVVEFVDAQWAKIKVLSDGKEGYVTLRYLAKPVSDDRLATEKQAFNNMFYVNYAFVNVRASADAKSEKRGEIPGQSIIRPLSNDGTWAKVSFQGKDGYISSSYIAPFLPTLLVRQEKFTVPVLQYRLSQSGALSAMTSHINALKAAGASFVTTQTLRDIFVRQGSNARLEGLQVMIAVSGLTPATIKSASDAVRAAGIHATFFIQTDQLGLTGITEKTVLTLLANGMDVQSATHTGDDLRSLTNAQVELELKQSRKLLEEFSRREVYAIAYPLGGVNDRVMEIAAKSGYLFGLSDSPERSFSREQLLRLPSFAVFPSMMPDEVVKLVKGN